jgi:hypothetical protein
MIRLNLLGLLAASDVWYQIHDDDDDDDDDVMMNEMALETSVSYRHLTWLVAREDFVEFIAAEQQIIHVT